MLNHKINASAPYTLQPPVETKPTQPPYKLLSQPLTFESKTMAVPYSLQRPIGAKSLLSPPNFPTLGKAAMDEKDFPQLPAATTVNAFGFKTHPHQQKGKSRNKKMLSVKIVDDPHISSKYIISPLATKKSGMNEAGSSECPTVSSGAIKDPPKLPAPSNDRMDKQTSVQLTADNSAKDTKNLPAPLLSPTPLLPITFQKKTQKWQTLVISNDTQSDKLPTSLKNNVDGQDNLQLPTDESAKDTIGHPDTFGSFTPFTPLTPATSHKKTKKWQPLNIPLNTHTRITPPKQWLPAREYYSRRRGQPQIGVLTPPKSVTDSANLITPEKEPIKSINLPQTPITNKGTPKSSTIPTSPSRKVTDMGPIKMPQESKKLPVSVKFSIKKHQNRGFLYKYPPRERPYYAMIQCRSEMVSPSSRNSDSCRYRSKCCFGHEEDRYFDSPWQVQRFVQGFNVDLWESRTELAGKQDLIRRREELMAIAEVVNKDGMKGGHRKLVEAERAKRGLKSQTDEWCWAGRTFRAKNGGSPSFLGKNWEDKTVTGASNAGESEWEVQTLTGSSVSSEDDDNDTIGPNDGKKRLFAQHLRAETEAYETRLAIAEQLREHERKLAREQEEFERRLREQQQEFEREIHERQVRFQQFYQELLRKEQQRQFEEQQQQQYMYQEQQRQYEAQRHMYNKPIMRPSPNSIQINNAAAPTVPYNKPIARPTSIATSIPSQPHKTQNYFNGGLGNIPHNLCPQYAQPPGNCFQGPIGEKWCYNKQPPAFFDGNHNCYTVQSPAERVHFPRMMGWADYHPRLASGQE